MKEEILRLDHVTTEGDEMTNLDNMSLYVEKGEIVGLLCIEEQGRNKLLEVLHTNVPIRYGQVYIRERLVNSYLNSDMTNNRVYTISSKNRLIRDLSVADNIFVLREGFRPFVVPKKLLRSQVRQLLKDMPLQIDPDAFGDELTDFERVVVELLRAVVQRADLIIMDDLMYFLALQEILKLIEVMRKFTGQGFTFLFIGSHHEEMLRLCDRVMIMRDGRIAKTIRAGQLSDDQILVVAGTSSYRERYKRRDSVVPRPAGMENVLQDGEKTEGVFEFRDVTTDNLKHVSFSLKPGECMVLLDRSMTQDEGMKNLLCGNIKDWSGEIICGERRIQGGSQVRLLDDSIAVIQARAHHSMIFSHLSFMENLCIMTDRKINSVFLQNRILKSIRREYRDIFGDNLDVQNMNEISVRDKYTLVYYRYYMLRPNVVFCIQPFLGADVHLRDHILNLILKLKERGIAVVILAISLSDTYFAADKLLMLEKGEMRMEIPKEEFKYIWRGLFNN